MPSVSYGSRIDLSALQKGEVARPIYVEPTPTDHSTLSWILTGLEIALAFVPGVGWELSAGIAAAGTAAQAGIEYTDTGKVSPWTIGGGIIGVTLPGIIHGISFYKAGTKLAQEAQPLVTDILKATEVEVKLVEELTQSVKYFESITDKKWINPKKFQKTMEELSSIEQLSYVSDEMKKVFESTRKALAAREIAAKNISKEANKEIVAAEIAAKFGLTKSEVVTLKKIIVDGSISNLDLWIDVLNKAADRSGNTSLRLAAQGWRRYKLVKQLTKWETKAVKKARIISKVKTNGMKAMGYITSPSSIISEIVSRTLGKLSRQLEEYGAKIGKLFSKLAKGSSKAGDEIIKEFERTGGRLFKSKWIMGYKPIQESPAGMELIIQFKPWATAEKEAVLVFMTWLQLDQWLTAPSKGRWYIDNIAKSRGGRRPSEFGLEGELIDLLGFLPVAQIQEVLGFASAGKTLYTTSQAGRSIWNTGYWASAPQMVVSAIVAEVGKGIGNVFTSGGEVVKGTIEDTIKSSIVGASFSDAFKEGFRSQVKQDAKRKFEGSEHGYGVNRARNTLAPVQGVKGITG